MPGADWRFGSRGEAGGGKNCPQIARQTLLTGGKTPLIILSYQLARGQPRQGLRQSPAAAPVRAPGRWAG